MVIQNLCYTSTGLLIQKVIMCIVLPCITLPARLDMVSFLYLCGMQEISGINKLLKISFRIQNNR